LAVSNWGGADIIINMPGCRPVGLMEDVRLKTAVVGHRHQPHGRRPLGCKAFLPLFKAQAAATS